MPDEETKVAPKQYDFSHLNNFAQLAKLTLQDLRKNNKDTLFFKKFTKENIIDYLESPDKNEKNLRNACIFLYNASSHFKRLVQYFARLYLLQYIIIPLQFDKVNEKTFLIQYKKVLNMVENMNLKHEMVKVLNTVYREDVFYGYEYSTEESYYIRKLNPDYCQISSVEDGCYNFAFDFSYFNLKKDKLESYGEEFIEKYRLYAGHNGTKGNSELKWQELDSKKTICIKANEDLDYLIPPFVGVLEAIYDLQDYKLLKKVENQNDNYKILNCIIPTNPEGELLLEEPLALKYYHLLEKAVPDGIGLSLSPMKIEAFTFANTSAAEKDAVAQATAEVWNSAGVSSLIFNNTSAGSTGLVQSIRADIDVSSAVIRQIERWINRKLKNLDAKYKFKIQILDVTRFNQTEMFDMYLKGGNSGLPVKTALNAILGYSPQDMLAMGMLENDILKMRDTICGQPLLSSSTMSPDNEGGRPQQETVDDKGQITRDTNGNDR